jgi:hypothetical protein
VQMLALSSRSFSVTYLILISKPHFTRNADKIRAMS